MILGLIGLPQTGKKTLFGLLAGPQALAGHHDAREPLRGVADVQDDRFDRLNEIYTPRKLTRARLDLVVLPKIEEGSVAEGKVFKDMGEIDAFCHVVRAFEDDTVYHVWGAPDPAREVGYVQSELVLHDLVFVEKRLERIDAMLGKIKDEKAVRERELLLTFKSHLESELPLRLLDLSEPDGQMVKSYPLLTRKEMIVALNVADDALDDRAAIDELTARYASLNISFVQVAVAAESEIARLESDTDRAEFMRELGIQETALHALTRKSIDALGLISFFTVGPNELRQWFVRRGSTAPQAAGTIHSDMERGFIRAEVMKFTDLDELGSEDKLKAAGKHHLKGKDYVVEDGDVVLIRFNV